MSKSARQARIRQKVQVDREVAVRELATDLGASPMTIRRDLAEMEKEGLVVRTHGGAIAVAQLAFEFAFHPSPEALLASKRAIAARAAALVADGQTVLLDTGTTTLELARALVGRAGLTVVTSSLAIVSALQFTAQVRTILLGGFLRRGSPDLWGPITERNLTELHVDVSFLGADAVGLEGNLYCEDLNVAGVAQGMIRAGGRAYVLADSSKLDRKSLTRYAGADEVLALITDGGIRAEHRSALDRNGLRVVVAGEEEGGHEG